MTFSFGSMIRLLTMLAVGSTMLAIGVSRLNPLQPDRRAARPVLIYNIPESSSEGEARRQRWFNVDSGVVFTTKTDADDVLETASCSPWVDAAGRRQVVGRWSNRTGDGPEAVCHSFGLGRRSFPDGLTIDQVATDVVPTGPPCWLPGTQARVVFAAGDGRLYRFDFESGGPAEAGSPRGSADAEPRALTWACPRPGGGEVFICQVARPEDPRMSGRLLATLRLREPGHPVHGQMTRMQLWWLELDHAASRIVAVGPLVEHNSQGPAAADCAERSPALAALPDGSLGLAYAQQVEGEATWSARLIRLELDADHRPIPAIDSAARTVAPHCHPRPPVFSTDGRWLNVLVGDEEFATSIIRVPTTPPR